MRIVIDISKDRYDEIMSMDWKNCRRFFDEEIRAIHDGKALEQEPKTDGDCISKEKVIDILDYWYDSDSDGYIQAAKSINELPFVNPQEPKTDKDCISREKTLEKFCDYVGSGMSMDDFDALYDIVAKMPSVQSKTGHWIEKDGFDGDVYYDCSECGESWATIEGTPWDNEWKYCPHCGAKMSEVSE